MKRKLCTSDEKVCWSLHALWDAEILKLVADETETVTRHIADFDLANWCNELNNFICELYEYPEQFTIEDYVYKYKNISLYLVEKATANIAAILNSKALFKL